MSDKLINTNAKLGKVKRFFIDQLWLILLFAPLLIIVLFIGKHYLPDVKASSGNSLQSQAASSSEVQLASAAMQITSAELSAIVAKPLGKLLLVEVYFDARGPERNQTASLGPKVDKALGEIILISQYGDKLGAQVTALVLTKEINNKKGEHS